MFPDVHSTLGLDSVSGGCFVNIIEDCDQLGHFMVHHFITEGLKSQKLVIVIGLEQTIGHFHAIGLKLGVNFLKSKEKGEVKFISVLSDLATKYAENEINEEYLKSLAKQCEDVMKESKSNQPQKEIVLIIDKLTLFNTLGYNSNQVLNFVRFLQNICSQNQSSLITLSTISNIEEQRKKLTSYLEVNSDVNVSLTSLKSGKSDSVTGNFSFEWEMGS